MSARQCSVDNWFVVQLKPNGLKKASLNLERQGYRVFVPYLNDRNRSPLFPGYVFVWIDPQEQRWNRINSTYGVARLVPGLDGRPGALPGSWMAGMIERCSPQGCLKPPEALVAGDRIRVVAGPFAEKILTIEALDRDGRLRVLFDLMGRQATVSLGRDSVLKAG